MRPETPESALPSELSPPGAPFTGDLDVQTFRQGARVIVERIARYLEDGPQAPVLPAIEPGSVLDALPAHAPLEPEPIEEILADFERLIYPALTHWNSPRYLAYFPSVASVPGILGEMLAAGFGQNNMLWRTSPGATELELRTLEWLRDLLGLPDTFFGHIVDTASTATLLALAAAREKQPGLALRSRGLAGRPEVPRLAVYASQEAHSSIDKAAMTLGYGLEMVRKIPADDHFRLIPAELDDAIRSDRAAGILPLAVVATVGTTSSTSIDPVPEIAAICERENLWLHVDAAYGGVAAICPEKREVLAGCERADSLVVNPHKWLFTPMDCSAFFVRDRRMLKAAFSLVPEYLSSSLDADERLVNLMDYGFQLGRRWRSLKLWMLMRAYGAEGLQARLRYHLDLARSLAERIDRQEGVERLAPVPFATVCFRFRPPSLTGEGPGIEPRLEQLNARVMERANATGEVFLSHTKLKGRYALRLAIGHVRTHARDIDSVWALLSRLAEEEASAA